MTPTEEAFVRDLIESCETHDAWLLVVRYGLATLLDNQPLLIEIIFREAGRWPTGKKPAEEVQGIFEKLGLRLELVR